MPSRRLVGSSIGQTTITRDQLAELVRVRSYLSDVGSPRANSDWRAEHVRFSGERLSVAYDWDSLARDREPALLGIVAHAFAADWTRDGRAQAPTLDEARAFVADYEAARGRTFAADERRYVAATFAFSCAYTARCGHALGADQRAIPGTFQHLVATQADALLAL